MTIDNFKKMLKEEYGILTEDDRITSINTVEKQEYSALDMRDDEQTVGELAYQAMELSFGFKGKYAYLSNMAYSPFMMSGHWFLSAEHAFHFWKCKYREDARKFEAGNPESIESPYEARQEGRKVIMRDGWNEKRVAVMRAVLEAKFSQSVDANGDLLFDKLATTSGVLCEYNTWGDRFWGKCRINGHYEGANHLGKLLTELRDAYIANSNYEAPDVTLKFEHQSFPCGMRNRGVEDIVLGSLR